MKYKVVLSVITERTIEIEADSKKEAINKVQDDYNQGKIVLGSEDYTCVNLHAWESETNNEPIKL